MLLFVSYGQFRQKQKAIRNKEIDEDIIVKELTKLKEFQKKSRSNLTIFNRKINIPNMDLFVIKDAKNYNKLNELEKANELFKKSKFYNELIKKSP